MNLEGLVEKRRGKQSLWYENTDREIIAKSCKKCSEIKALKEFPAHKTGLGGKESVCKICKATNARNISESERREAGKPTRKRPKIEERSKVFGKICGTCEEWRSLESFGDSKKGLGGKRSDCKVCEAEGSCKRYEMNPEYSIIWQRNNPDKLAIRNHRRRARKKALESTLTTEQYTRTHDYFEGCALTGQTFDLDMDHAIPISIGHGGTTFGNCYPLSLRLNRSKNDRNIFEWFEANRQRFNLEQWRFDRLIYWLASANAMSVEKYRVYVYECHANPNVIDDAKAN
jgi:hypothetical protein